MVTSFNGIGTRFMGFSPLEKDDSCTATMWFTFLFFPIIPLYRARIRRMPTNPVDFVFILLEKQKLETKEIIKTYILGLFVVPFITLIPLLLIIPSIGQKLGLPGPTEGVAFIDMERWGTYEYLFAFAIVWLITAVIFLANKDSKKGLPSNWKKVAAENKSIRNKIQDAGKESDLFNLLQQRKIKEATDLVAKTGEVTKDRAAMYSEYFSSILFT